MTPDRTIAIPAPYMGMTDALLTLETADGERGDMELTVAGETIARGEGFRAPEIGLSLLEQSDARLAGMFGAFLAYALEASEEGAQDAWSVLSDAASDWTDALALMEMEEDEEG